MLNLLYQKLPDALVVDGTEYAIKTDFRDWIWFAELLENQEMMELEKACLAMQLFTERRPLNVAAAFCAFMDFAACKELPKTGITKPVQRNEPVFSCLYDSPYIYGAFLQAYGIDLCSTPYLHWYRFHALLTALPDCPLSERIGIRSVRLSDVNDSRQRIQIIKRQDAVRIPCAPMDAGAVGAQFD